jgi:hypothetical protein
MSNEKTIRIGADTSGAEQSIEKLRGGADKVNKSNIDSIREQIRLLKELDATEESNLRRRERRIREEVTRQRQENNKRFNELSKDVGAGYDNPNDVYGQRARVEREKYRNKGTLEGEISEKIGSVREKFEDERSDRKKQIRELQGLRDQTKEEGGKSRDVMGRVFGGASSAVRGDVGGVLTALGVAGGVIGLGYAIYSSIANSESGIDKFSMMRKTSPLTSAREALRVNDELQTISTINMIGKAFLESKVFPYSIAAGRDLSNPNGLMYTRNLVAIENSRNLSQSQIEQSEGLGRYDVSKRNTLGYTSAFEGYLKSTKDSIIQLPELFQSYLGVANGILNRIGEVNSNKIQNVLASIGGSYGVEGINIDRFAKGFEGAGSQSGDPFIFALQQQAIRKTHPKAGALERFRIMENPLEHMDYITSLIQMEGKLGGGGEAGILAASIANKGKFSSKDIEKILNGTYNEKDFTKNDFIKQQLEDSKTLISNSAELVNIVKEWKEELGNWFGTKLDKFLNEPINKSAAMDKVNAIKAAEAHSYKGAGVPYKLNQ